LRIPIRRSRLVIPIKHLEKMSREYEQLVDDPEPGKEYHDYVNELKQLSKEHEKVAPYMFGYPNNLRGVGRLHDVSALCL
jgi:hypothetical protein